MTWSLPRTAGLALACALLLASPAHAEAPYAFDTTPGKLPKNIVPLDYAFRVAPDLDKLRFSGQETVRIQVRSAASEIVLNALELEIGNATLSGKGIAMQKLEPELDAQQQTLRFALASPLQPGEYTLAIDYAGKLNAQPQGLYYERYPTARGTRTIIGTEMEPADARRLLPCWDEPAFRASFQLTVDLPRALSAYSNTPIENTEKLRGGLQRIRFGRTPSMASYLVVLVAGDLERVAGEQDGVDIGIVATEGKKASTAYALQASRDLLHYFNGYFGVPFPLPKLDQIAIPGGFGGAMENWGGITYNESLLLFDPENSDEGSKQAIYSTIAHEMAHQWFGDLVTTAWWDNLWLNEGFASWMGTKATGQFNPDWRVWLQANQERERAMELDARATTHPIQQAVKNESDANDAFDDITYLKGQSFLRMLETWLGEDAFRSGIRAYMARHQYSNTTTADLWTALDQSTGKPVTRMARSWTEFAGFPLITAESSCKNGKGSVTLTQQQFHAQASKDPSPRWTVPIAIASVGAPRNAHYALLENDRLKLEHKAACDDPLLIDPESVGYYRIAYSDADFAALAQNLPRLPDAARLKLISDTWALVANGARPLTSITTLFSRLGDEPQRAVWEEVADKLMELDRLAIGSPAREPLRAYAIGLLKPKLLQLGWTPKPSEPDDTRLLRAKLIEKLGKLQDRETVAQAQQRFREFLKNPESLPASIADTVIEIAGREADAATWKMLRERLAKAITSEDRSRYFNALCAARDPSLAAESLKLALDPKLPSVMALRAPREVAANEHIELAWAWTKANGDALLDRLTSFERNEFFGRVLNDSTNADLAADLETYAAAHLPAEALTETHRVANSIRLAAERKTKLLPQVKAALPATAPL